MKHGTLTMTKTVLNNNMGTHPGSFTHMSTPVSSSSFLDFFSLIWKRNKAFCYHHHQTAGSCKHLLISWKSYSRPLSFLILSFSKRTLRMCAGHRHSTAWIHTLCIKGWQTLTWRAFRQMWLSTDGTWYHLSKTSRTFPCNERCIFHPGNFFKKAGKPN